MNVNLTLANLWRFLILVAIQTLVLKQMTTAAGAYFNVMLYPMFVFLLPVNLPTPFAVLAGLLAGFTVDYFYLPMGVHASAGAFAGFLRAVLLKVYEPSGGFNLRETILSPRYFGWPYIFRLMGLFYALFLFWYFSVEQFTFVYWGVITLKTVTAWPLTMIFAAFFLLLFNPKS